MKNVLWRAAILSAAAFASGCAFPKEVADRLQQQAIDDLKYPAEHFKVVVPMLGPDHVKQCEERLKSLSVYDPTARYELLGPLQPNKNITCFLNIGRPIGEPNIFSNANYSRANAAIATLAVKTEGVSLTPLPHKDVYWCSFEKRGDGLILKEAKFGLKGGVGLFRNCGLSSKIAGIDGAILDAFGRNKPIEPLRAPQ